MDASHLAAWAQVGGTLFAACALVFTGLQIRHARKTAALNALQDFTRAIDERERTLDSAREEVARHYALTEFMNCLELYSAAYNDGLLTGVAKEIVRDKLLDSLAILEAVPGAQQDVESNVLTDATFTHLARFIRNHRALLNKRRAQIRVSAPELQR